MRKEPQDDFERLIKGHEDAQLDVMGCVVLAVSESNRDAGQLIDRLKAVRFSHGDCRVLRDTLVAIRREDQAPELVGLNHALRDAGRPELIGWAASDLSNRIPSAAGFDAYLADLAAFQLRRDVYEDTEAIQDAALNPAYDPPTLRRLMAGIAAEASKDASLPIMERLKARRFDFAKRPDESKPRFLLGGTPIATPGNLVAVSAAAKSGKSSFLAAAIAAVIAREPEGKDFLGVSSENPAGHAVLHFDSEQSPNDHWRMLTRSMERAGIKEAPAWLQSFCLTGLPVLECRVAIDAAIAKAHTDFGGIHSVILDGVADFVADVNDAEESGAFVAHLHALATKYSCPVVGVIHLNPGTEKTRGHLGSQLERKSESNLRLEKKREVVVVWSEKNRGAPILKNAGTRFAWCDKHRMHRSVQSLGAERDDAKLTEFRRVAREVFKAAGNETLRWKAIIDGIAEAQGLSESGARKQFGEMKELGILQSGVVGGYVLSP